MWDLFLTTGSYECGMLSAGRAFRLRLITGDAFPGLAIVEAQKVQTLNVCPRGGQVPFYFRSPARRGNSQVMPRRQWVRKAGTSCGTRPAGGGPCGIPHGLQGFRRAGGRGNSAPDRGASCPGAPGKGARRLMDCASVNCIRFRAVLPCVELRVSGGRRAQAVGCAATG